MRERCILQLFIRHTENQEYSFLPLDVIKICYYQVHLELQTLLHMCVKILLNI